MKRNFVKSLAVFLIMSCLLTGCGGSSKESMNSGELAAPSVNSSASSQETANGIAQDNYAASEEMSVESVTTKDSNMTEDGTPSLDSMTLLEEKLVYHCNLDIETLDYPSTVSSIKETISKYDGVIQSENESDSGQNWYFENYRKTNATMHNFLEVRIPSRNYEVFLAELDGVGKIVSKSSSVENISQQYYDTTTQIESLRIQERNLLEMMEKCETIEDMITVEERLAQVQSERSKLETAKRYMDTDVAFSYVNITISEVMEYHRDREPVKRNTFVDRLINTIKSTGRGFLLFLEGLLFLLIRLMPYLIVILGICLCFRKKIKRYLAERKAEKQAEQAQRELRRQSVMQQYMPVEQAPPMSQQTTGEENSPTDTK